VIAKLVSGVSVAEKRELTGLLEDEQMAIEHLCQRAIGRRVTLVPLGLNGQHTDDVRVFVRSDKDLRNRLRGPEIDQGSIRFQPKTRTAQGIDHALRGESSQ
jgi:hypothetical protein